MRLAVWLVDAVITVAVGLLWLVLSCCERLDTRMR